MVNANYNADYAVLSKSIRGASHKRKGKPNQDSLKVAYERESIILTVADGHGSDASPFSKSGSMIAVNVFCSIMAEYCHKFSGDWDAFRTLLSREGDTVIARRIDSEWKKRVMKAHNRRLYISTGNARTNTDFDNNKIWRLYGSTLLGVLITPAFIFAYQLGDGDIVSVSENNAELIIKGDNLLGVETHSLSGVNSWQKAKTAVYSSADNNRGFAVMLCTDGFTNSYHDENSFLRTCVDYYKAIGEHGAHTVNANLKSWLNDTSKNGSGDDISMIIAYQKL